jgi:pyruvate,water dikinase
MDGLWLGEEACHDVQLVGGKAANLSRLAADYRVPVGFCMTPGLRARWLDGFAGLHARWSDGLQRETPSQPALPQGFYDAVSRDYQEMAIRCRLAEPTVAVRSSAIEEDGLKSSFAGQYDTYLNIRGAEEIAVAIVKCWDSVTGERMSSYRKEHNLPAESSGVAVLVQQLIPAEVSGVVFSANPISGSKDEVMINSTWGLGESVVSGKVTPDTLIVRKADFKIKDKYVGEKGLMTVLGEKGTKDVSVPISHRRTFTLDAEKSREITQLALDLESRMGWPVDLEFAYYANDLYLLQCRPITTL